MRAVIYCRVSTKDQVRNLSLSTQEKACVDYAIRNGFEVEGTYVEQGESAKTVDRTELQKLLTFCRKNKGRIHAVVVYSLSRFARDTYGHHVLRQQLLNLGITLRSATEPIDDSSTGKLSESILAAMAQFDNDVRSERTVAGMKARLERGDWTFPPPLGYAKSRDTSGGKSIIPDPKRAHLITKAFELYATGLHSKKQVLDIVSRLGLTTKSGTRVSQQTFNALLRKPIYAGVLEVPTWGIRQSGKIAQLVSRETFDRVGALLDGKRPSVTPRQRNHPDFPLRHFVRCGRCGRPVTASWSKGRNGRYAYYRCQNRACKAINVSREKFERLFIDFLGQLRPKSAYLHLFGEIVTDLWNEKHAQATALHETVQRRLDGLRGRRQRLLEAFIYEHAIDKRTFDEQSDALNEEIALAELEERDARIDELDVGAAIKFGEFILLNASRLWSELPPDQKQRLQQVIFPHGVEFEDGVYRTAETSMIFFELESEQVKNQDLVALAGIEPAFRP